MTDEAVSPEFARRVGERLRAIRRQQDRSLLAVEAESGREFKASVLGAYERGERVISVLRLQRLARLYGVPVDQLLPRDDDLPAGTAEEDPPAATPRNERVTLDLARLSGVDAPEADVLRRYSHMIQVQRGDFNGRMLTIRAEDVRALGRVFGFDEAGMRLRLEQLGVLAWRGEGPRPLPSRDAGVVEDDTSR